MVIPAGDTLSGFGAALQNWQLHHRPDPNPALPPGTAYLPKIDTTDRSGADTWDLVNSLVGYVEQYERNFAPHTTQSQALALLRAQDLPLDAQLGSSHSGATCRNFVFRSATLARMVPGLISGQISLGLYSPGNGSAPYRSDDVEQAILDPASNGC